ncbi:MAG: GyrI-like domain-containing protein [Flavobacterium sp. MedPE-SWcel]|uniref:GyrI-like domain-containing protein n=1 Tax=uncultured Flavobacterium sp. TaxID=165435 RepID=UPI000910B810|nr:GyrI-like domain-containing protein [uncultured Flavobacterium sp.]OIQ22451.1 MAG: GyrI-like domain-containing protein [Flavobacterium sp. MedPE-SWcel]
MLPSPTIKTLQEKILVGQRLTMSFVNNKTAQLWGAFMPLKGKVVNTVTSDLYSVNVYPEDFFLNFNPTTEFEKWAASEVTNHDTIPDGMESFTIPEGLYAVFHYKGSSDDAPKVFQYIFSEWLPQSGYTLDNRPHFEVLGDKYRNSDPLSEEEIWIPIKTI